MDAPGEAYAPGKVTKQDRDGDAHALGVGRLVR